MTQLDRSLAPFQQELAGSVEDLVRMLELTYEGFIRHRRAALDEADALAAKVHEFEKTFAERVIHQGRDKEGSKLLLALVGHVERVGDCIEAVVRTVRCKIQEGTLFSDKAVQELTQIFDATKDLLRNVKDAVVTGNLILLEHVVTCSDRVSETAAEFSTQHQERLISGICQPKHSSLYLDLVDNLRTSCWHAREMALKVKST
jgi:Na+/phosphate symporter